jgi:transcriptional regulator with XRE-family HTH domain
MPQITASQIRAGRHLANLSQEDIVEATGLPLPMIERAESEREAPVSADAVYAIRSVLEAAGIAFTNGNLPGVSFRALKPGEIVRHAPTGKTGKIIDRIPPMGGMVWVQFYDGSVSVERGKLTVVLPTSRRAFGAIRSEDPNATDDE